MVGSAPHGNITVTAPELTADLRHLGITEGSTVLVHSSLSRLGRVEGGAAAVIDALLEAAGSAGTVLFPTLTGSERDGPAHPPVVDVRSTPCWTGRIPEAARRRPDAIRSLHPTHSVAALGAGARRHASGHERGATPCDAQSPYHRLIEGSGFILLLGGVTQESNTTLHCLEELAGVPYHLQRQQTVSPSTPRAGDMWSTTGCTCGDGSGTSQRSRSRCEAPAPSEPDGSVTRRRR